MVLIICIAKEDQQWLKWNLEQLYKSIIELDVVSEIIKSSDFPDFKKEQRNFKVRKMKNKILKEEGNKGEKITKLWAIKNDAQKELHRCTE